MYKESRFNTKIVIDNEQYIYNSLTKAYIKIVDEVTWNQFIEDVNSCGTEEDAVRDLIGNGFIVETEEDELEKLKYIYNKNYFNENTLSVGLVPSMACNFACPYCFEEPHREEKFNENYFAILKKYGEKYFKLYNHVDINLFGGEPLLFFNELSDYLDCVLDLSVQNKFEYTCSIITNGSLVTTEVMEMLKKHNCNSFQITLDGSQRTHDATRKYKDGKPSFHKIIEIINTIIGPYLVEGNFNFKLRFNLLNNTLQEIEDSLELIDKKYREYICVYFRKIYTTSCYQKVNSNDEKDYSRLIAYAKSIGYNILSNQYFERSCEACSDTNFGYITPDLSIWKCINLDRGQEDAIGKIGKIDENGNLVVNSKRLIEWYKGADCFNDEQCQKCSQLADCLGGCIAYFLSHGKRKCSDFNLTSLPFMYQ